MVDSATAAKIEGVYSNGGLPGFSGHIAVGTKDYNRDYNAPDHHAWNWYVASVDSIFDVRNSVVTCECPIYTADPSDISRDPQDWINKNGNVYTPKYYQIQRQIQPGQKDFMANVSNRGLSGAGERTLITGFIITGGEPRNVVLRALGPSLSAAGIRQFATNPRLRLYQGSTVIAGNSDWKQDARATELSQKYPSMVPTNDNEAALLVTLYPGTYTLQGNNDDGTEGIILLEAYDVDSTTVP
jgi:hypothetical protein